jgi:hypothetical protein
MERRPRQEPSNFQGKALRGNRAACATAKNRATHANQFARENFKKKNACWHTSTLTSKHWNDLGRVSTKRLWHVNQAKTVTLRFRFDNRFLRGNQFGSPSLLSNPRKPFISISALNLEHCEHTCCEKRILSRTNPKRVRKQRVGAILLFHPVPHTQSSKSFFSRGDIPSA